MLRRLLLALVLIVIPFGVLKAALGGFAPVSAGGGGGNLSPLAVTFQNTSGSTEAASYVTLGQVFKPGDVQPTDNLVLDCGSGNIYAQKDNLASNLDGSVRHAALTAIVSSIAGSTTTTCHWKIGTASAPGSTAPTAAALAASSYDVGISFSAFYVPTPNLNSFQVTQTCSTCGTSVAIQITCTNAAGETLPSTTTGNAPTLGTDSGGMLVVTTILAGINYCGLGTGFNVYANGHKQNGSPVSPASTYTISGIPTTGGAAPPSSNTALISGASDSASCKTILSAAISGGKVQNWLSGAAVNEFDVSGTMGGYTSGKLIIRCFIRAYADGTTMTDVVIDASQGLTTFANWNYNITITQGSNTTLAANGVQQQTQTQWHQQVYSNASGGNWTGSGAINNPEAGTPNIGFNYAYLRDAGAVLAYDTSFAPSQTYIDQYYNTLTLPQPPMSHGTIDTSLNDVGNRPDIAPLPMWATQWLLSGNYHARVWLMANADGAGSAPWHMRDESTDLPLNANNYLADSTGPLLATGYHASDPIGQWYAGSSWGSWDNGSHMPELNYIPYLITADHYRLLQLQYQINYGIFSAFNYGQCKDATSTFILWVVRSSAAATACGNMEPRQQAWDTRGVAELAYITPSSDSLKSYFTTIIENAIDGAYADYITTGTQSAWGAITGWTFIDLSSQGPAGQVIVQMDSFMGLAQELTRRMNISTNTTTKAAALLKFKDNFLSQSVLQGDPAGNVSNTFASLAGAPYWLISCNSGISAMPCGAGHYITTWGQFYTQNINNSYCVPPNGCGANGVPPLPMVTPMIQGMGPGPCSSLSTGSIGGYPQVQLAEQAAAITGLGANSVPEAVQAWAFNIGRTQQAYTLASSTPTCDFQYTAQYDIAPQMPDGNYLYWSAINISTAANPNLTASGGDQLIGCVDSSATCALTGAGVAGTTIIMECDQISAAIACTMTAAAGENDFMFGAWQGTNVFNDNTGSNYMVGSPSGGTNNFKFNANSTVAKTATNFRHGVDTLTIKASLNGGQPAGGANWTAAAVIAKCSTVGGNGVFAMTGNSTSGMTITTTGVPCASLSAGDVVID